MRLITLHRRLRWPAIALALALVSATARAQVHEDRLLRVASDGTIVGLPAQFSPATLRVVYALIDGERRVTTLALAIRDRRVELPLCVVGLLNTDDERDMRLSASWDHDEEIVPYYLQLRFFDPGFDSKRAANSGFALLFNLRTAKLIEMDVDVVHDRGERAQTIPVDLRARCADAESAAFLQRPH